MNSISSESCQPPPPTSRSERRITPTGLKPAFSYARIAATLSTAGSIVIRWWPRSSSRWRNDAPNRRGAHSPTVQRRIQEEVDLRVPVLRLELLGELDQPGDGTVDLDRQAGRLGLVPRERVVGRVPPAHDLRRAVDAKQLALVTGGERAQDEFSHPARPSERTRSSRWGCSSLTVSSADIGSGPGASRRRDRP